MPVRTGRTMAANTRTTATAKPKSGKPAGVKSRKKRFSAVSAVKEMARERIGPVPVTRRLEEKKSKPLKHKKAIAEVGEEE